MPVIPPIIMLQPWLPIMSWQCFCISVRHSDMGLSDRRQAAICSCMTAIFSRISGLGADAAEGGGLAAKAAPLSASSKALVIDVAARQARFETAMALSSRWMRLPGSLEQV